MILGTYWYSGFPTGLYRYDYFQFQPGSGGHADSPAGLTGYIETDHPDQLIADLKNLVAKNAEGTLFIYHAGQKMKIETGGYRLFDYDFELIREVEKILTAGKARIANEKKLEHPAFIRLQGQDTPVELSAPKKKFLQVVSSGKKMHNAETSLLRLDCNLALANKSAFITALKHVALTENLGVFYYLDNKFDTRTNLMLFFSNGRQGVNLAKKQSIDIHAVESKLEEALIGYDVQVGYVPGYDRYPQNGPHVELMVDREFILG